MENSSDRMVFCKKGGALIVKRTLEKVSILSLSLILISTYSVSSVIPMMTEHFSEYSRTDVEQLVSIPSFAIMIMIMLNTRLSEILSERFSIVLGMLLIAAAGTVPVFVQQYGLFFVSRILMGVGIGLVNAHALHMINERYEGEERAALLGYRAAAEGLGNAVLTLIAGWLLGFGWKYAFLIYVASLPILLLYLCFVPKKTSGEKRKPADGEGSKETAGRSLETFETAESAEKEKMQRLDGHRSYLGILLSGMLLGALAICINSANTLRIPGMMLEKGIGTEAQSSVVLSIMMATSIAGGVIFGKLNHLLKEKMIAVCMLGYAAGMILMAGAHTIWLLGIGAMLAGAAQNLMVTALFNNVSNTLPQERVKTGTTFVLVGCNLGSSCSALLLKVIGMLSQKQTVSFVVYAVILVLLAAWMLGRAQLKKRKRA